MSKKKETPEQQLKNLWAYRHKASLLVYRQSASEWCSERALVHENIRSIVQAIRRDRNLLKHLTEAWQLCTKYEPIKSRFLTACMITLSSRISLESAPTLLKVPTAEVLISLFLRCAQPENAPRDCPDIIRACAEECRRLLDPKFEPSPMW